jgi:hypothetical protein
LVPLLRLHGSQLGVRFSITFRPPRLSDTMWSQVVGGSAQYEHKSPSGSSRRRSRASNLSGVSDHRLARRFAEFANWMALACSGCSASHRRFCSCRAFFVRWWYARCRSAKERRRVDL